MDKWDMSSYFFKEIVAWSWEEEAHKTIAPIFFWIGSEKKK